MTPAERFIKAYLRTTILEDFLQGLVAAGGGAVMLVGGGKLFVKYGPLLFGNAVKQYSFCVLAAALAVSVVLMFQFSSISRRSRGSRAIRILQLLSKPGSKVSIVADHHMIQPYGEKLSRHELAVFRATLEGEIDSRLVIPPRLPTDPATLFKNVIYLLIISAVAYHFRAKFEGNETHIQARRVVSQPISTGTSSDRGKHFAPEGVYYLLTRVSFSTDSGVVGIPRGAKVTLVRRGNPMRVTNGEYEFEVSSTQVTNDQDVVSGFEGTQSN